MSVHERTIRCHDLYERVSGHQDGSGRHQSMGCEGIEDHVGIWAMARRQENLREGRLTMAGNDGMQVGNLGSKGLPERLVLRVLDGPRA